jgi:hypothetical protein
MREAETPDHGVDGLKVRPRPVPAARQYAVLDELLASLS